MQNKRVYQSRLMKSFGAIAVVVAAVLLLSLVLMLINIEQSNNHMLQNALEMQIMHQNSTLNYVTETINRFTTNNDTLSWARSDYASPDYYFYALKLYQRLREESSFQNYMNIEISLTSDDSRFFVISASGTMPRESYDAYLSDRLSDRKTQSAIYPLIEENKLIGLTLVAPRNIEKTTIYFLCSFHLPQEIAQSPYFSVAIYDSNRGELFSSSSDFEEAIKPYIDKGEDKFKSNRYTCFTRSSAEFGFSFIYGYKRDSRLIPILILSLLFCFLVSLIVFAFSKLQKTLYKPIGDMVNQLSKGEITGSDEFAVINENCQRIEYLNKELNKALNEQFMLEEQQKYRSFLNGTATRIAENDRTQYFTVALLQIEPSTTEQSLIIPQLDTFSKKTSHLHFVRTNPNEAVLIQKAETKEESLAKLMTTINSFMALPELELDVKFAIAESKIGFDSIQGQYNEAKEIIQYRHRIRNKAILTIADIADKDAPKMYFPFQDESKLIATLLAGKNDAIAIYDRLVEINTGTAKALLPEELKRFAYMMIGLVNRLFQELKEEPIAIVGHNIDYNHLYNEEPQRILDYCRQILLQTISSKHESETAENNKVINAMKEYINQHYMENIMLIDLSQQFNLTPKYCSRIFNQFSKDNFKNYLNKLRIQKAQEMIEREPEIKISYLSHKTGFSSSNTFIRVFYKYVGITPKLFAEKIIKRRDKMP